MNRKQKTVLIFVVVIIAIMLLIPPFHYYFKPGVAINLGYSFLFAPPMIYSGRVQGSVDVGMLITQWLGVLIIGGIIVFMLKEK